MVNESAAVEIYQNLQMALWVQGLSNLKVNPGVDSSAARGFLPSVDRDCVREGLPTSANVHSK